MKNKIYLFCLVIGLSGCLTIKDNKHNRNISTSSDCKHNFATNIVCRAGSAILTENGKLSIDSYFKKRFGVVIREDVLIRKTIPNLDKRIPLEPEWIIYQLNDQKHPINEGIRIHYYEWKGTVMKQLDRLDENNSYIVTVYGFETIKAFGQPNYDKNNISFNEFETIIFPHMAKDFNWQVELQFSVLAVTDIKLYTK